MKRVLTSSGKFVTFVEPKKESENKQVPVKTPSIDNDEKTPESGSTTNQASNDKKFELTGKETAKELKAMLNEVGVKYPKQVNKDKLVELLKPFTVEKEDEVDL